MARNNQIDLPLGFRARLDLMRPLRCHADPAICDNERGLLGLRFGDGCEQCRMRREMRSEMPWRR